MSIHEIESKARELRELTRMQEELADEITALQDAIKAAMGDQEQVIAGEYKITYKRITAQRVDTKALKSELPDIAARFTKTMQSRRFTVQ